MRIYKYTCITVYIHIYISKYVYVYIYRHTVYIYTCAVALAVSTAACMEVDCALSAANPTFAKINGCIYIYTNIYI